MHIEEKVGITSHGPTSPVKAMAYCFQSGLTPNLTRLNRGMTQKIRESNRLTREDKSSDLVAHIGKHLSSKTSVPEHLSSKDKFF